MHPPVEPARPTDILFGDGPRPVPTPRTEEEDATGGFARLLVEPVPSPGGPRPQRAGRVVGPVTPEDDDDATRIPATTRGPAASVGPEVIRGAGRTTGQVLDLVREARREHPDRPAIVVGADAGTLVALATKHDAYTTMDHAAMAAAVGPLPEPTGRVAVLCAGAADVPVAAEAAFVARVSGTEAVRVDDVGGGRLHALLADGALLADVDCVVVVAGLDASLATTIGELTGVPVVAVPTSAGQAGGFGGIGALLTMLNSGNAGVVVSAIDNGYAAGVVAARIARR